MTAEGHTSHLNDGNLNGAVRIEIQNASLFQLL